MQAWCLVVGYACMQALRRGRLDEGVRVEVQPITERCHPCYNNKMFCGDTSVEKQYGLFKPAGKAHLDACTCPKDVSQREPVMMQSADFEAEFQLLHDPP